MKNENEEFLISTYIKRYPFNGRSEYLIDKFYIIGYNASTLNKLLFEDNSDPENLSKYIILDKIEEEKKSSNLQSFHFEQDPIILNEISSDFDKKCLNYDIMKSMIFPNNMSLYYSEEDNKEKDKEKLKEKEKGYNDNIEDNFSVYEYNDNFNNELLKNYCVIFSSNPQTENNSKKSINGFAYIFYKKLIRKQITSKKIYSFYIPVVFSIVSEYPFFNSFYKLCRQIKTLFNIPKNYTPIEIMLYNIIKYTESPINCDVNLSIKPFLWQIDRNIFEVVKTISINEENNEDEVEYLRKSDENDKKDSIMFKENKLTNKNILKKQTQILSQEKRLEQIKTEVDKLGKFGSSGAVVKNRKPKNNKINLFEREELNLDELFPKIKFEALPGYPLIQYNLAKVLLDIMSPIHVIEIFLYTFLEKNVIFFSKNLQYLSITINSYLNLNFPLNDEKYYFINASVSLDNYINNNSPFIGAAFTTIVGINSPYNVKYLKSPNKIKDHLVVNLDKDEIYKISDKDQKENSKKNKDFFTYIRKICKKEVKNVKKQTILCREVYNLYKTLSDTNNLLHNIENDIDNSDAYKLFKNGDYMDYDDSKNNYIKKINIRIQNAFYRLINNLCLYFYQHLSIKTDDDDQKKYSEAKNKKIDKTEMNVIFLEGYQEEDDIVYLSEEIFFLEELRETMKYESFVYCFIQSYSPIDLYKIPLTFTEEFLSIIKRKESILEKDINFLEIIDRLYEMKRGTSTEIEFLPFFAKYNKDYKKDFEREIEEMNDENMFNEELIKVKYCYDKLEKNKYLKYKDYELDNNLLMKYLNIINNLNQEDFDNIFYMSSYLNRNKPEQILVIDIENIIENYSIETHLLSQSDLCCSNIILLFSLSLKFLDDSFDWISFLGHLFNFFTVFRKYYSYITNMMYALCNNSTKNNDYTRAKFYSLLYFICLNSMRNLKLVPNESLMKVMKKFNDLGLKTFDEKILNQNKNETPGINKAEVEQNKNKETKFPSEKLDKENLYPIYNFGRNKIYKEEEIIELLSNESSLNDNSKKIYPKIRYQNKSLQIETLFFSQLVMINKLIEVYNKFIVDLNEEKIDYELLMYCCMNILVYMRNLEIFNDLEEIKDGVKVIFYLILNKFANKN